MIYTLRKKIIDGATANATSSVIEVANARKITIFATRADHSAGSSVLSVDVSVDGVTFVDYNKLITNVANDNTEGVARAASLTLSADGTNFVSLDPTDAFQFLKVSMTRVTDGTNTAWITVEYDDLPV